MSVMMSSLSRTVARMGIKQPSSSLVAATSTQGASLLRFKTYDMHDRERALENKYFSVEDEKLMRKLLKKARASAAEQNPEDHHKHSQTEEQALRKIVDKYQMSKEDVEALKEWRHSHEF